MAKKRASRKKSKKPTDWAGVGRWALRSVAVLLLLGLAVGLTFGVDQLRLQAAEVLRAPPDPVDGSRVEVSFNWPPLPGKDGQTWLPDRDQAKLIRDAEYAAGEADPLSVDPLKDISQKMAETGWFESAPPVRRVGPGKLHVSPDWRLPGAVVRWRNRDHLISTHAMPMPPVDTPGWSPLPVIIGCSDGPDGSLGSKHSMPWPGQDVHSGLDLILHLWREGLLEQVSGIDVSAYRDGGPFEIVTTHGTRVVWGSAPGEWKAGEPSVEERVQRLKQLIETTGRIDGGQRRIEIHRARVEIDRTGDD